MMSPEDEQKMENGQAMGKSFMIALAGIVLALAEEEARLVGVGIAVAGVWFYVSLRKPPGSTVRLAATCGAGLRRRQSLLPHSLRHLVGR